MEPENWSERKKYLMESIRMIVFGIIGFIAINIIASNFKSKSDYQAFINQERIKLKKDVIDSYLVNSYLYTSLLHDVLNEEQGEDIDKFEEQFDLYRNDLNKMMVYFGDKVDIKIKSVNDQLKLLKPSIESQIRYYERKKLESPNNENLNYARIEESKFLNNARIEESKFLNNAREKLKSLNNETAEAALIEIGLGTN